MAASVEQARTGGQQLAEISRRVVQVLAERAGKGPTKAKSYWAGDDAMLVLLGGGLTRGEQTLHDQGHGAEVAEYRRAMQEALESDLRQIVEETLDRRVIAFMSTSHQDPDINAELFILAPFIEDSVA